jgi:hypothetical protein
VRHGDIDVFLCGVAGRQFTDRYAARIIPKLNPKTIVITHHDDFFRSFFRSLDQDPGPAFGVDVARFPDEVEAVTRHARLVTLR